MTDAERRKRIIDLSLAELKASTGLGWYFISVANATFLGGFLIRAQGPHDALSILHHLGLYPVGSNASTETSGPMNRLYSINNLPKGLRRFIRKAETS